MAGKIANTRDLMGSSWRILKEDRELLFFPVMSGFCLLLVVASFASSMWWNPTFWHQLMQDTSNSVHEKKASLLSPAEYAVLFLFYFCNYFVITFFNTGLMSCAMRRLRSETATFGDGLADASQRLHQIAVWALIAASVGLVLRIIEDKSKNIGALVAGLLGTAFSVASFFVIPVMIAENKNPFSALAESSDLFRKTWGERFILNMGWGMIFFFLIIPAFLIGGIGILIQSILLIAAGAFYFAAVLLVSSALQSIFQAALYLYAKDGDTPSGFDKDAMQHAFGAV